MTGQLIEAPHIGVLGPLRVGHDAAAQPAGQARRALCWLVMEHNRPVPNDRLTDLLWGDTPPRRPRRQLAAILARAAETLEGIAHLDEARHTTTLRVEPITIDAERFATVAAEPASVEPEALEAALRLWRGEPYSEIADHTDALPAIVRLQVLRARAVESLSEARLAADPGDPAAIAELEALIDAHPDRRSAWMLLAGALRDAGRRVEALRVLDRARNVGGGKADPAMAALEAEILEG